jgi:hypothetical protein
MRFPCDLLLAHATAASVCCLARQCAGGCAACAFWVGLTCQATQGVLRWAQQLEVLHLRVLIHDD